VPSTGGGKAVEELETGTVERASQMRYCVSLADSMRPMDELAISCFNLGVALPSGFPAVIVQLGLIRTIRKGRGNHNEYRRGHCRKKHLFHDSLLRELYLDPGF
jgi:hypothetical protein